MGQQLRVAEPIRVAETPLPSSPPAGPRSLFALMASQHGVASTSQSRTCGVTRSVERRLIREGALHEPLPGVLAAGGTRPTYSSQAMAASLLPGVQAISHGAAARLHRLEGFAEHPHLDVVGTRGAHLRPIEPVVAHYTRGPLAEHLVRVGSIPVTSIPVTLVMIATQADGERLRNALHDALRRGVRAADVKAVLADWQVGGRAGPHRLAKLLDAAIRGEAPPTTRLDDWRRRRQGTSAEVLRSGR